MNCDVVVIGAGPSGTIAAGILHKNGFKVRVVEKEKFPRFVIGESLLPRCMVPLEESGLMDAVKAKGFQIKNGAKFVWGEAVCDFEFANQYTEGWGWTWQVPRADFDHTLAKALEEKGVPVHYETSVENIEFGDDKQLVEVKHLDGTTEKIECRFVVDGSGYGRVIPRMLDLEQPSDFPPRKAIFSHVPDNDRGDNAESERIDIVTINQHLWAWVIPFSNGNASIGFVGEMDAFDHLEGSTEEKLKALIRADRYINGRLPDLNFIFPPREITGYSVSVKQFYGKGYVLTGNSTEFLDPVFSSGVTFAMESAATAAKLLSRQLNGETVNWEKDYTQYIKEGVNIFRSYVIGWYDGSLPTIFYAPTINPEFKKQICSVLAGYVWDKSNPFVSKHETILQALSKVITIHST